MPSISSSLYSKVNATSIGLILTSFDLLWPLSTPFFTSVVWAGLNLIWHWCRKGSIKREISYTIPINDKFGNVVNKKTSQLPAQKGKQREGKKTKRRKGKDKKTKIANIVGVWVVRFLAKSLQIMFTKEQPKNIFIIAIVCCQLFQSWNLRS